jgi:hypothetical protein
MSLADNDFTKNLTEKEPRDFKQGCQLLAELFGHPEEKFGR